MNKKIATLMKYQTDQVKLQSVTMILVFAFQLLVAAVIGLMVKSENHLGSGSIEIVAIVYAVILGVVLFGGGFKVAIENGASRKTYYISMLFGYLFTVTVFSLATFLFAIPGRVVKTLSITRLVYGDVFFVKEILFYFCVILLFMSLAAFFTALFKRVSKKTKYIIFLSIIFLVGVITVTDFALSGLIHRNVLDFTLAAMGIKSAVPNILIAALSCFILSALFFGGIYLLIRKAELKH